MTVEATPILFCNICKAPLAGSEICPRCLFGDVLAVVEGPTPPRSPSPASQPRTLGEYELIAELGQGGMGIVWKARQRRLNRIVALKLVRGGALPGEVTARRLRREAEAVAQLKHPNIIVIHEVGEHDGQLYLSMDLAEGGSLADWLKRVAFSPRDTAALMVKVARGVHHAHEHHILHRDLKPANILLEADGEPRICDFGLARMSDMESSLTMSGEFLGTPAYLSPEQAAGNMKDLTPASDIYSLGALLYEMLSGHPPFSAENIHALLRKVAEEDTTRPISHHSGARIPYDLSTICLKCLEKEPRARYPTALALAEDLDRWLLGEPILARPVARAERVWKWARRKPVLAALWLACTALLIIVALVATVMGVRLARGQQQVEKLAEASRRQLARQLSESAQQHVSQGDYLRGLPALAEAIDIGTGNPGLDKANRIRFGFLTRASPDLAMTWFQGKAILRAEATADGTRIFVAYNQSVEVWDTTTGRRVGEEYFTPATISNAQFDSSEGRWVLIEDADNHLMLWEPDTNRKRSFGAGSIFSPPDAYLQRSANFISYHGTEAVVRALATGKPVCNALPHNANVAWATLLPKSKHALSCDEDGLIYLWDAPSGELIGGAPISLGKNAHGAGLEAYHPERRVAILHKERDCWLLNCETGQILDTFRKLEDLPQTFGWHEKDGLSWLTISRNNEGITLRKLDTERPKLVSDSGQEAERDLVRWFGLHRGLGFRGSFAPGKTMVATQSWNGSARVWKLTNGRPLSPYLWQTATPGSCILDPNGRWLMTRGDEPGGRLWMLKEDEGGFEYPEVLEEAQKMWYASNPERLFAADVSGEVHAWTAGPDRRELGEVVHPELLQCAGPAAGGAQFFTAGPRHAQLWDATTFHSLGQPYHAEADLLHTAADPGGGKLAVVLHNGDILIWDALAGKTLLQLRAGARRVEFSPDGRLLLALGDKDVRTWDATSGRPVSAVVDEIGGAAQARFSPDGRKVVQWSGRPVSGQSRAKVWATDSGKILTLLPAHWLGVRAAAWSPDGRLLATGGNDQTVLFCDAETGMPTAPPIKHFQKIADLGFSSDGLLVWTIADKEINIFDSITGESVTPRLVQSRAPLLLATSPTGNELVTISERSKPLAWDLRPDAHTPVDLRGIAHALSSHALVHGTSALRPLSLVELRAAWEHAQKALKKR